MCRPAPLEILREHGSTHRSTPTLGLCNHKFVQIKNAITQSKKMSIISATYLIIFLPLAASVLCQVFAKKEASFLIATSCFLAMLILVAQLFPNIFQAKEFISDFELSPLSLALEFKIDAILAVFLFTIILLKLIILFYYQGDIKNFLDQKNGRIFYSVYLLHLFTLAGILTSNNLLNLFIFLEIYAYSFFAIFSISKDIEIAKLSFRYFCLNSAASLLILFCFLIIYLMFGSLNLDVIKNNLVNLQNVKFSTIIAALLAVGFVIKFFPFWLYFENLKNSNLFANFFAVDSLFIKANVGIFLALKFSYLFFVNDFICLCLILLAAALIFYSIFQIYKTKHFKLIAIYLCLNNFGFILISLALHSEKSLQAGFFYWMNFNLINFFLFIFATFLKRKFNTSLIDKISLIGDSLGAKSAELLLLPLKIILFFVAAFPFTFLFYGNWNLIMAALAFDSATIAVLVLGLVIVTNFALLIFGVKFAQNLFLDGAADGEKLVLQPRKYWFYFASFWAIIFIIAILIFSSQFLNKLSFATF